MAVPERGSRAAMESSSREVVNDQTGESSPGVIEQVEHDADANTPASPTPEPPETAEETEAADESR
jgi:hypothetical protein